VRLSVALCKLGCGTVHGAEYSQRTEKSAAMCCRGAQMCTACVRIALACATSRSDRSCMQKKNLRCEFTCGTGRDGLSSSNYFFFFALFLFLKTFFALFLLLKKKLKIQHSHFAPSKKKKTSTSPTASPKSNSYFSI
jgi:hypothetical protein